MTRLIDKKWLIFCVVAIGVFMSTLDSSMVNIALPTIMGEFKSSLQLTEWIVLIYLLTVTSLLLVCGHLSDYFGRRTLYSFGLIMFATGSLACAMAPGLWWLIGSRFFQAIGAAMMMSTGPAIIKDNFPPDQLGRGLGMIGISVSLGLMSGPVVSGLLMQFFSWRAIFLITVPIGFIFAAVAGVIIPKAEPNNNRYPLNWRSAISWAVLLAMLSLTITYVASPSWSSQVLALYLAGVGLALVFLFASERLWGNPLLPIYLLKKRFFYSAIVSAILSFMVLFTVLILTPFFLDLVLGMSKAGIGMIMMSVPLTVLIVAPTAGWLADHVSTRILSTSGLIISTISLFFLSNISEVVKPSQLIWRLMLLGCGQALFLSPNSASVLHRVTKKDSGKSAALLATARNLGMLLGIGMASFVFSWFFSSLTNGLDLKDFTPDHINAFMTAMHNAFIAAAIVGIIGVAVSWMRESTIFERRNS